MSASKHEEILGGAVAILRDGREVRVTELAESVGITAGLIYRYFENKDDLLSRAYERLIEGYALKDAESVTTFPRTRTGALLALRAQARHIYGHARRDIRWTRLEALAHARLTPSLEERIHDLRKTVLANFEDGLVDALGVRGTDYEAAFRNLAFVVICLPLGFTALGGDDLTDDELHTYAEVYAGMIVGMMDEMGYPWEPEP